MPVYDFFLHNWKAQARLESAYLTDIVKASATLTEERRALADRPQRVLSLRWTGMTQAQTQRMLMTLMRAGMQAISVPYVMDQTTLSVPSVGALLTCDTTSRHFAVGAPIVIYTLDADSQPSNVQTGVVQAMDDVSITLAGAPSGGAYPAGSLVLPLMVAEIVLDAALSYHTDRHGDLELAFVEVCDEDAQAASTTPDAPGDLGTITSDANPEASADTPVLAVLPDFGKTIKARIVRDGAKYPQGRSSLIETRGERPYQAFSFSLLLDRDEAWSFLNFFDSRLGRALPFWFVNPSTLWTVVGSAAGYVDVTPSGDITNVSDFAEYVAVALKDGTLYVVKVASVTLTGGNWRIASLGIPGLSLANIAYVTLAHFVRFAKDSLVQDWNSDNVCQIETEVVEILAETVPDELVIPSCVPSCWHVGIIGINKNFPFACSFFYATSSKEEGEYIEFPDTSDDISVSGIPVLSVALVVTDGWVDLWEDGDFAAVVRVRRI